VSSISSSVRGFRTQSLELAVDDRVTLYNCFQISRYKTYRQAIGFQDGSDTAARISHLFSNEAALEIAQTQSTCSKNQFLVGTFF
jgi:hypothetical protein